jgi:hypothetical protein
MVDVLKRFEAAQNGLKVIRNRPPLILLHKSSKAGLALMSSFK